MPIEVEKRSRINSIYLLAGVFFCGLVFFGLLGRFAALKVDDFVSFSQL